MDNSKQTNVSKAKSSAQLVEEERTAAKSKILNLPENSTEDELQDLANYKAKAKELEERQLDRIKLAMDEFNKWLKAEGFQLNTELTVRESWQKIGEVLSQLPPNLSFNLPVGVKPIQAKKESE